MYLIKSLTYKTKQSKTKILHHDLTKFYLKYDSLLSPPPQKKNKKKQKKNKQTKKQTKKTTTNKQNKNLATFFFLNSSIRGQLVLFPEL